MIHTNIFLQQEERRAFDDQALVSLAHGIHPAACCSGSGAGRPLCRRHRRPTKQETGGVGVSKRGDATAFLSYSYTTGNGRILSIGSGFIVDEAGTILTNAHVVEGAHRVMARLYEGARVRAEVLDIDS